jgi:PiT family inorganic phosphate transporter
MFDLELSYSILLIVCLIAACGFEFVNGFHDTANAVATVIYTNSLKPWFAVIWSGIFNFAGVFLGGIGVAISIINLLPVETLIDQNIAHSISMVMALLISAITWNLLTWYFGIPCSSSHTLLGSILGVAIAYSLLPGVTEAPVNWDKASQAGMSLLISPLFGFSMTIIIMFIIKRVTRKTAHGESLFKEPKKNSPPPTWIRAILILTCTSVSLSHGSNDGQKGVGLIMLILIGIVPTYFALDTKFSPVTLTNQAAKIEQILKSIDASPLSDPDHQKLNKTIALNDHLKASIAGRATVESIPKEQRFDIRKDIMLIERYTKDLLKKPELRISESERQTLENQTKSLRGMIDYSPFWVIFMIALSLGLGTMIGWKRIVKTIGEKIGKEHLNYAQGASAELVAASTITISTMLALPVSTTHVLSSGIAGSMVANKGIKNLQADTVRNILIAWFLTLPIVMLMAGALFLLFRAIF